MRAAALLVLLAAGCATAPPAPLVVGSAKAIEIARPVGQACIEAKDIVPLPPSAIPARPADIESKATGVYADLLRYLKIAKEQQTVLRNCAALAVPTK